jgi:tripartite-type tricarboxylate transporter receptor subunit TctC
LLTENWYGMVAPAATPPAIIAALNRIATEAMRDPAVKEKLAVQGAELVGDSPKASCSFACRAIKSIYSAPIQPVPCRCAELMSSDRHPILW